jgi:hypothetical protein
MRIETVYTKTHIQMRIIILDYIVFYDDILTVDVTPNDVLQNVL